MIVNQNHLNQDSILKLDLTKLPPLMSYFVLSKEI